MARPLALTPTLTLTLAFAFAFAVAPRSAAAEEHARPSDTDRPAAELLPQGHVAARIAAAGRLGELGGEAATDALARTLRSDPSEEVRLAAIEALGRIGSDRARRVLVELVDEDPMPTARARAVTVIVSMAPDSDARAAAVRELGEHVDLDLLRSLLDSHPDPEVRLEALALLDEGWSWERMRDAARQAAQGDRSERVREAAVTIEEREASERIHDALQIAGVCSLGAGYLLGLGAALIMGISSAVYGDEDVERAALRLLLPVAGAAWAVLAYPPEDNTGWRTVGVIDTILQATGLALTLAALLFREWRPRRAATQRGQGRPVAHSFAWSL
jgi:hypothetical protein